MLFSPKRIEGEKQRSKHKTKKSLGSEIEYQRENRKVESEKEKQNGVDSEQGGKIRLVLLDLKFIQEFQSE